MFLLEDVVEFFRIYIFYMKVKIFKLKIGGKNGFCVIYENFFINFFLRLNLFFWINILLDNI